MPIHDWTRVSADIFHDFHCSWITYISSVLNNGLLPPDYYALSEQVAGELEPDVLTLQTPGTDGTGQPEQSPGPGAIAVALAPPRVRFTAQAEMDQYVRKQRRVVIRHSSGDRLIAIIEILSPGNKSSRHALCAIVNKAVAALARRLHLLLIDLHPPTPRDPQGIHGAVWAEITDEPYTAPPDKPLTLVAYRGGLAKTAFIAPVAVGDVLIDMPLFLDPDYYINVPLDATYQSAWRGVPRRYRSILEDPNR